jgi:hypothetical protein
MPSIEHALHTFALAHHQLPVLQVDNSTRFLVPICTRASIQNSRNVRFAATDGDEYHRQVFHQALACPSQYVLTSQTGHLLVQKHQIECLPAQRSYEVVSFGELVADVSSTRQHVNREMRLRWIVLKYCNPHSLHSFRHYGGH